MAGHGVVSADSHMMEPADLWQERLGRAFRERAPHVIENPDRQGARYLFVAEGAPPFPVAGGFAAGRSGKALSEFMSSGYEAARPSGWDPVERIKDQELDGIDAEVLYPTLGMTLFAMSDAALQRACFAAYNGWVAEFCRHDPRRLYGIGLISLEDVGLAVQDLEQIARLGMRGAMIWGAPPSDRPYSDRGYDPFWDAAQRSGLPVSLHIIASRGRVSLKVGDAAARKPGSVVNPGVWYMTVLHEIQESLASLVFGGVLERFPQLRIVSAENDTGWLPHFLYRMDHAFDKYRAMMPEKLSLRPSEYVRRQVWATFQDDPIGPGTHHVFGADNYMWASDFPHTDSTFPESRAWIEKNFAGVPEPVKRRIVYENAVALYRMELGEA
jgi:predicted TIM-barrel fold metal-dependent hydrolase